MKIEEMSLQELEQAQEKHRRQLERNREKIRLRKVRTHKLIVMGSEVAPYIPQFETLTDEQLRDIVSVMVKP